MKCTQHVSEDDGSSVPNMHQKSPVVSMQDNAHELIWELYNSDSGYGLLD